MVAMAVGLMIVAGRLVWVQGLASDRYVALAATQRERRATLPAERGSILDREGHTLAMSTMAQTIYANPRFVPDARTAAARLAPVLGRPPEELAQKLGGKRGFVYLARKVDDETASRVKALGIPGVDAMREPKRLYPAGQLAAHVLGFVGTDNAGLAGLESYYDRHLAGRPGEMVIERDPQGRSIPSGKSRLIPPSRGDDLVLTIDSDIQYAAEAALAKAVEIFRAQGGSVLVMRPDTGEILAIANLPTFDPNDFGAASGRDRRNRALIEVYEPGSANKVITAAAALESGTIGTSEVLAVPDNLRVANKTFHDSHPHPVLRLTFPEVIEQSSNIGTIKVALRLGKERLHEYLARFGYGAVTGIAFPGESPGLLTPPDRWWPTQLGTAAIGQSVAVTPLQIMSVYATVANGGVWVQPSLASGMIGPGGRVR
ncbi:MAG: peptidoglycan D,D-transpeptidase FtsI family protein, partial [Actinomycetota bacterium]